MAYKRQGTMQGRAVRNVRFSTAPRTGMHGNPPADKPSPAMGVIFAVIVSAVLWAGIVWLVKLLVEAAI